VGERAGGYPDGMLLPALLAWSLASAQTRVTLDAHRHFSDRFLGVEIPGLKSGNSIDRDMAGGGVERALLISDAYLQQGVARFRSNEELAAFVAAEPDRFAGLCGLNTAWDDAVELFERCLARPGMVGGKLHFRHHKQRMSDPETAERLTRLADVAERRRAMLLIHMNFESDPAPELAALLAAARGHPLTRFVIAHAAEDSVALLANAAGAANVYTEVSTFEIRKPEVLAAGLRSFGIDRVLFGIDGPIYGAARTLEKFQALPLTQAEKTRVLETNGAAFWDSLPR